jgi:hypothetical protein
MRLPAALTAWLFLRLLTRVAARRKPDFIVGADNPAGAYLLRWYLTPWRGWYQRVPEAERTRWQRLVVRMARWLPNLYLHKFLRDDDDRALHDHPSWAASLMLDGYYIEHTIAAGGIHQRREIRAGTLRYLPTRHTHRIELPRLIVDNGDLIVRKEDPPAPCWTLFLFGPTVRDWGFHCPERGWVHWRAFTAAGKPGEIGPGCDA